MMLCSVVFMAATLFSTNIVAIVISATSRYARMILLQLRLEGLAEAKHVIRQINRGERDDRDFQSAHSCGSSLGSG